MNNNQTADMINRPIFILNPSTTKKQLEEQALNHLITIRHLIRVLPDKPFTQFGADILMSYFSLMTRLIDELQDMLLEIQ